MLIILVAYLGGVLTILSPCILPVLPFVFARSDQPFARTGLPILIGMAATFTAIASLAAIGGGWIVQANEYGRLAALVLMAVFGVTLLLPRFADRLTRPIVAMGSRLSQQASGAHNGSSFASSLLLGIATGLLWAPCAGPILGLLLTGAALKGASLGTSLLLLAYAAGAATSLAVALLVGGRVFARDEALAWRWRMDPARPRGGRARRCRGHRARPRYRPAHTPVSRRHERHRAEPARPAASGRQHRP